MKQITNISRILVGALFIISGLIKLNDPVGFSFKLKDYFAPDVLNIEFFSPFALMIALFVVIFEVIDWCHVINWICEKVYHLEFFINDCVFYIFNFLFCLF